MYLLSSLTGRAAAAMEGLQYSDSNYVKAIDMLKHRYGKYEALIEMHMKELTNLSTVASCSDYEGLRRLSDKVQVHTCGLESLGVKIESYASMLLPVLKRSLPAEMQMGFQLKQRESAGRFSDQDQNATKHHEETLKRLMRYIEDQAECREESV